MAVAALIMIRASKRSMLASRRNLQVHKDHIAALMDLRHGGQQFAIVHEVGCPPKPMVPPPVTGRERRRQELAALLEKLGAAHDVSRNSPGVAEAIKVVERFIDGGDEPEDMAAWRRRCNTQERADDQ